jgi:hypothetical protein
MKCNIEIQVLVCRSWGLHGWNLTGVGMGRAYLQGKAPWAGDGGQELGVDGGQGRIGR